MSPRYSTVWTDRVQYSFWLVFDEAGGIRLARAEPSLDRKERAVSCSAVLPRSLWRTPRLSASITVAEGSPAAFQIDVEAVTEAIKHAVGLDIDLRIEQQEPS